MGEELNWKQMYMELAQKEFVQASDDIYDSWLKKYPDKMQGVDADSFKAGVLAGLFNAFETLGKTN